MASEEHLAILKSGVVAWNDWREREHTAIPDLSEAELSGILLTGADLQNVNLRNAKIGRCPLDGARFDGADLSGCVFYEIGSSDCDFTRSNISRTIWRGVKFEKSSFNLLYQEDVRSGQVIFEEASFKGCDFLHANLRDVHFLDCKFENCNLSDVKLMSCVFPPDSRSSMLNCALTKADLARSDLRGLSGIQFDHNRTHSTILPSSRSDDWSELRRIYTGTRLLFNIIILGLFFIPLFIKALYIIELDRISGSLYNARATSYRIAETIAENVEQFNPSSSGSVRSVLARIAESIPEGSDSSAGLLLLRRFGDTLAQSPDSRGQDAGRALLNAARSLSELPNRHQLITRVADEFDKVSGAHTNEISARLRRLSSEFALPPRKNVSLVYILLGLDRDWRHASIVDFISAAAGILLILYNVLRSILTFFVTAMRDEELITSFTPWRTIEDRNRLDLYSKISRIDLRTRLGWTDLPRTLAKFTTDAYTMLRTNYYWLAQVNSCVSLLQYVAYASAAVNFADFVTMRVGLPM